MTEKELLKIKRSLKTRAKKLHLGKKRTGAYVFGTLRKIRGNPVRTKTWKLGEYGGNIKANVNESGTAVQIIHSDKPLKAGAYGRLFRWPLDKFELEMKLNDLTTSYYASKIIEWVESVTKGTNMNPSCGVTMNPANPAAQKRRDEMAATILITAIESGYGWFHTKNYKIAEIDDTPYKVTADLLLDEEVTKDDYPDEFSKDYQPKRTFKVGEKIHVDNSTIQKGLQLVSSGKIKVADSYRKLASKLYFWPYSRTTDDMPDFDAYDADIFLQAGVFGNVIFG